MESKSCSLTASLTEEGHDADGASAVVSPCRRPTSNRQLPHASYMKPPSIEPKVPPVPAHDLAHVLGFFQRLGLHRVVRPLPAVLVWSIYVFVNGFMTIAVLGPYVTTLRARGLNARELIQRAPFDLVFANILLSPLLRFAAPLAPHPEPVPGRFGCSAVL